MTNQLFTAKEISIKHNVPLSSITGFIWANNMFFDGIKKGAAAYKLRTADIIGCKVKASIVRGHAKAIRFQREGL